MFKLLVLQDYYGLSDELVEFEIIDGTSFLGIGTEGSVPESSSVWNFKEKLGEE